jgi:hypothetical protein
MLKKLRLAFAALSVSLLLTSFAGCRRGDTEGRSVGGETSPQPSIVATPTRNQTTGSRYEDKKEGFAFTYPDTWDMPDAGPFIKVPEKVIASVTLSNNWNGLVMLDVLTLYVYGLDFEATDQTMDYLLSERIARMMAWQPARAAK